MSLTRDEVIRYLESLSSAELGALADEVLARLGMAPVAVAPGPPVLTMGELMGIPGFDVVLRSHGSAKIAVVAAIRRVLGPELGLQEAKKLVESAPVVVCEQVTSAQALEVAAALRHAGADVEVR